MELKTRLENPHPVPNVTNVSRPEPLKWLGLQALEYAVPGADDGKVRHWESVYRTQHGLAVEHDGPGHPRGVVDATDIIAVTRSTVRPALDRCVVVVMQYRPAVNAFTLEFPAGCIDKNETSAVASAVRELKEETGLTASNVRVEYKMTYEPGITSSCGLVVSCDVDMDAPENDKPEPELEDDEFSLQTFFLPLATLPEAIQEFTAKHDYVIVDSRLGAFALALQMQKRLGL
ncbi:hypothetical protein H9P43_004389 [Blastocladiella emersonii ATCC 22665]|nr:hypothetical protein H9P43_004389 [Blastocladiella emersonii ATCC 22665]